MSSQHLVLLCSIFEAELNEKFCIKRNKILDDITFSVDVFASSDENFVRASNPHLTFCIWSLLTSGI